MGRRPTIKKVDANGKVIKSYKTWRKKNPDALCFDSKLEYSFYKYNVEHNIAQVLQPTIELFSSMKIQEFDPGINPEWKTVTQRKISYTPDYYLPEYDVYIEVKGYADEMFKLRWKLFRCQGYRGYTIYNLDEYKQLLKLLQNEQNQ